MSPLPLVFRLLHILPAVFLAGGILFMWSSLLPGLTGLDEETRKSVFNGFRSKWAKVVMICSALLLISGLYNAVQNIMAYEYALPYHGLVALKLVLGIVIMFITSRLAGRSETAEKFREKMPFWMSVNTALVLAIIVLGSTMRAIDKTPKAAETNDEPGIELNVEQEE